MSVEDNSENKFVWRDKYVMLLIQIRLQLDDEFENPKTRKSKIWERVSNIMKEQIEESLEGLNGPLCDSKWRNLLQTYKKVAFKKAAGIPSSWPYYEIIHDGFGQKVVVKASSWYDKDEEDTNWFDNNDNKNHKDGEKSTDPLVNLKRKAYETDKNYDDDDSDDEKPIKHKLTKKKKKTSVLQLLRNEIAQKRIEDKTYQEEKRKRWEEKKMMESERTQALLQLTEALKNYTSKKIELVVSQRR